METTYMTIGAAQRLLTRGVMPTKRAVGGNTHGYAPLAIAPTPARTKSNVVEFSNYYQPQTEIAVEELEGEITPNGAMTLRDQFSLGLEFVATGGILAMATAVVVMFL